MGTSLYELKEQYNYLMDLLYDDEVDEQTLMDTLEGIEGEIEVKAENYAKIMRMLDEKAAFAKAEEDRLKKRRESLEKRSEWLKGRLYKTMKETGKTKFDTELFSFIIKKNGGVEKIDITGEVPAEFLKPGLPDNTAIRKALKEGRELPFAKILPRGDHLEIR